MDNTFRLFSDEQEAMSKMKADGMSDDQAYQLLKQRRDDLMGGKKLNPVQAAALSQMRDAGVRADDAVKRVVGSGETPVAPEQSLEQKIGQGVTNFALGNLSTIAKAGGNTLDFLTGGKAGFGEMVKEGEAAITPETRESGAFTAGKYAPTVASMVVPVGGAAAAGSIGLQAARWAVYGGLMGAANPILEKGSEATGKDIATGGGIGASIWAIAPAVAPALSRMSAGSISRSLSEATGGAQKVAKAAREMADHPDLQNIIEGAYKDGTKLMIPRQEGGIQETANSVMRKLHGITEDASDETMTRLANRGLMTPSTGKSEWDLVKRPEAVKDGLESLWKAVRSGDIEWTLDNMVDAARATMSGLEKYGKIIGDAIDGQTDAQVVTSSLADIAKNAIQNATKTAQRAPGFDYLGTVLDDLSSGSMKLGGAAEIKSEIGAQLAALKQSGNAGTKAYKALSDIYAGIQKEIDGVIDTVAGKLPELQNAREMYRNLKTISLPMAKSFQVEMRQAPSSLTDTMAMMQHMSPADFITNPLGGLKDLGVKTFSESIKNLNSREGNLGNFFRILDQRATSGKWGEQAVKQVSPSVPQEIVQGVQRFPAAPPGSLVSDTLASPSGRIQDSINKLSNTLGSRIPNKAPGAKWVSDIGE